MISRRNTITILNPEGSSWWYTLTWPSLYVDSIFSFFLRIIIDKCCKNTKNIFILSRFAVFLWYFLARCFFLPKGSQFEVPVFRYIIYKENIIKCFIKSTVLRSFQLLKVADCKITSPRVTPDTGAININLEIPRYHIGAC